MMIYGRLDEQKNVVPSDTLELDANRRVAYDEIEGYRISTVFLAIDHSFGGEPRWFETMIFGLDDTADLYCKRYATWQDAVAGHADAVQKVKTGELPENKETRE